MSDHGDYKEPKAGDWMVVIAPESGEVACLKVLSIGFNNEVAAMSDGSAWAVETGAPLHRKWGALPRNPRLPKNSPRCPKIHRRCQQGAPDGAGAVPGLLRPPHRRAASISRCRPWRKAEQQDCDMALASMMD